MRQARRLSHQEIKVDLSKLLGLIDEMPAYRRVVDELEGKGGSSRAAVLDAAKPFLIASLHQRLAVPMLIVTSQPESSRKLYEQLSAWRPSLDIKLFPEPESLPYEFVASDTSSEIERLQALAALANIDIADNGAKSLPVIIASAAAFMQKVTPFSEFTSSSYILKQDMEVEPFQMLGRLQSMGYKTEDMVELPGTVSHRGGIIDIFPSTGAQPVRLEFWGNTIDSIRLFDPASQRSVKEVSSITIAPATELLTPFISDNRKEVEAALNSLDLTGLDSDMMEQLRQGLSMLAHKEMPENAQFYTPLFHSDSLLDYLPKNGLLILDEPQNIKLAVADFEAKADEQRAEKIIRKELPSNFPIPYFVLDELDSVIKQKRSLLLTSFGALADEPWHELHFTPAQSYAGQLPMFVKKAQEVLGREPRLIVVSHQASRLSELLDQAEIIAPALTELKEVPLPGSLTLLQGLLAEGWVMNGDTLLLTDAEIFGFMKQRRMLKKRPVPHHKIFIDMKPGEYVVHIEHGIARFAGMAKMNAGNGEGEKEYLVLEYAAGDRLYLPADQIDRASRYVGAGGQTPVLSRLGSQEWSRTKKRVKDSVADIAGELIDLYAAREIIPGYKFSEDTVWQQEVEASFPYVETPDQLEVQRQVKEDMENTKPMDRLVCGDVGYGKTEVAIRAAFKAVMDSKQVAVLVPTTVLAEQHLSAFKERMSAFPVRIEVLSRFRTHREQQEVVKGLADGSVDICIGTHRIIQKDIKFKDLGLLIIDEEQRFGVAHKEYLKTMRQEVDVLTLSATPIPRTLHMSLVGVRDMSVMEPPPEERLPIKTYVAEFDEYLVREAILRELERNGQVFFVHNRVQSIGLTAMKLQKLVPEARIAIAHGQMAEGELEKVMTAFVRGESDVLVCSSIIQSGLDMPKVNTLIVNQADKFGLTQLHQLRGRVGRGAELAYAYFLYDKGKRLSPVAELRLRTIVEASELGAGFGIAMKDLEIRGAGSLLGMRQSGHISAVGFNLYCQLLSQAVDEKKAVRAGVPKEKMPAIPLPTPTIDLPLPAFIPADYVADLLTRLGLYQRLAKLDSLEQIEPAAREFVDRFGQPPEEVENLLYAIRIKILATKAGIESITTEHGEIILNRFEGLRFDRLQLEPKLRSLHLPPGSITISGVQMRIYPKRLGNKWREVVEGVVRLVG